MDFIRVTKANSSRDRGLISADAICAVFEDREKGTVSVMTMDGFWYEVIDSIEKFLEVLGSLNKHNGKVGYMKQKRMLAPFADGVGNRFKQGQKKRGFDGIRATSPSGEGEGRQECTFVEGVYDERNR